jgi:hypothetical protein
LFLLQVHQLVEENESLHDRLAEQASRMEGRALLREGSFFDGADRARLQVRDDDVCTTTICPTPCVPSQS